jgi:hypothetical protein
MLEVVLTGCCLSRKRYTPYPNPETSAATNRNNDGDAELVTLYLARHVAACIQLRLRLRVGLSTKRIGRSHLYGRGIIRDGRTIEQRSSVIETKVQCLVGIVSSAFRAAFHPNQVFASVPLIRK